MPLQTCSAQLRVVSTVAAILCGQWGCAGGDESKSAPCDSGYERLDAVCVDIDECAAASPSCPARSTCLNTAGAFECDCGVGNELTGTTDVRCVSSHRCALAPDACDELAGCTDIQGAFICGSCPAGTDDFNRDGTECINDFVDGDDQGPTVVVTPAGGEYNRALEVSLVCHDQGGSGCGSIYYTTDATTPSRASTLYEQAIMVDHSMTLSIIAYDNDGNAGTPRAHAYVIDNVAPSVVAQAPTGLDVPITAQVTVEFSEAIVINDIDGPFLAVDGVTGTTTYDATSYLLTFTPDTTLPANAQHTARLSGRAVDTAGHELSLTTDWSFTTKGFSVAQYLPLSGVEPPTGRVELVETGDGAVMATWVTATRSVDAARLAAGAPSSWAPAEVVRVPSAEAIDSPDFKRTMAGSTTAATITVEYGPASDVSDFSFILSAAVHDGQAWHRDTLDAWASMGAGCFDFCLRPYQAELAVNGDNYAVLWRNDPGVAGGDRVFVATHNGAAWSSPLEVAAATRGPVNLAAIGAGFVVLGIDDSTRDLFARKFDTSGWVGAESRSPVPAGRTAQDDAFLAQESVDGLEILVLWVDLDDVTSELTNTAAVFSGTDFSALESIATAYPAYSRSPMLVEADVGGFVIAHRPFIPNNSAAPLATHTWRVDQWASRSFDVSADQWTLGSSVGGAMLTWARPCAADASHTCMYVADPDSAATDYVAEATTPVTHLQVTHGAAGSLLLWRELSPGHARHEDLLASSNVGGTWSAKEKLFDVSVYDASMISTFLPGVHTPIAVPLQDGFSLAWTVLESDTAFVVRGRTYRSQVWQTAATIYDSAPPSPKMYSRVGSQFPGTITLKPQGPTPVATIEDTIQLAMGMDATTGLWSTPVSIVDTARSSHLGSTETYSGPRGDSLHAWRVTDTEVQLRISRGDTFSDFMLQHADGLTPSYAVVDGGYCVGAQRDGEYHVGVLSAEGWSAPLVFALEGMAAATTHLSAVNGECVVTTSTGAEGLGSALHRLVDGSWLAMETSFWWSDSTDVTALGEYDGTYWALWHNGTFGTVRGWATGGWSLFKSFRPPQSTRIVQDGAAFLIGINDTITSDVVTVVVAPLALVGTDAMADPTAHEVGTANNFTRVQLFNAGDSAVATIEKRVGEKTLTGFVIDSSGPHSEVDLYTGSASDIGVTVGPLGTLVHWTGGASVISIDEVHASLITGFDWSTPEQIGAGGPQLGTHKKVAAFDSGFAVLWNAAGTRNFSDLINVTMYRDGAWETQPHPLAPFAGYKPGQIGARGDSVLAVGVTTDDQDLRHVTAYRWTPSGWQSPVQLDDAQDAYISSVTLEAVGSNFRASWWQQDAAQDPSALTVTFAEPL